MKSVIKKPACPKYSKPMNLASTGSKVRTFYCVDCKETKIVKREGEVK